MLDLPLAREPEQTSSGRSEVDVSGGFIEYGCVEGIVTKWTNLMSGQVEDDLKAVRVWRLVDQWRAQNRKKATWEKDTQYGVYTGCAVGGIGGEVWRKKDVRNRDR